MELTQEHAMMKQKVGKRKVSEDEKQARLDAFDLIRIPHPRLRNIREKTRSLIMQTTRVRERNEAKYRLLKDRSFKREKIGYCRLSGRRAR
jgi:hypothetical protein